MGKILIFSDKRPQVDSLKRRLETLLPVSVSTTYTRDAFESTVAMRPFDVVVIKTSLFDEASYQFAHDILALSLGFPMLVLADFVHLPAGYSATDDSWLHVLNEPVDDKGLAGMIRKLIQMKQVPQQRHRRYRTNQHAELQSLVDGVALSGYMVNLSRGGASFEVEGVNSLTVGDPIRFRVRLDELGRERAMQGRVVWVQRSQNAFGKHGVGVEFVTANPAIPMPAR